MITAQVSLYPLQVSIGPVIREAVRVFRQHGLETRIGEMSTLQRSVAGGKAYIVWHTTLFSHGWPCSQARLPWGGFIGMALVVNDGFREVG